MPSTFSSLAPHSARALAAAFALAVVAAGAAEPTAISEREAEIFAVVINHGLEVDTRMVVVADRTTGDPAALAADLEKADAAIAALALPPAVFKDWSRRNARSDPLDRALNLEISYQMLDAKTLAEIFKGVEPRIGWQQFFARFAGAPGLLRVSHVGFDDSGQHALVYVEHQCGAECGAGRLVYLTHATSGWTVKTATLVWMVE